MADKLQTGKKPRMVASLNPDDFVQGGLPDDFDGEITAATYTVWDYDGKAKPTLAARLEITPSADSGLDPFTQFYSAGDIAAFAPSRDGDEPVDWEHDEKEGRYAIPVGSRREMNASTNWAKFMSALRDSGFTDFGDGNIEVLEGVFGHWNRVPQPKRTGLVNPAADDSQPKMILVITELKDKPKSTTKSAGSGKAASTSKKAAPKAEDDFTERLQAAVLEAVASNGGSINKGRLAPLMMKAFEGGEKGKAVTLVTQVKFLAGIPGVGFDADSGMLSLEE